MPRSCPQPATSRPSTVTLPPDALSSPMATRSAVVLPQPLGPISTTISPSRTEKLTRSSALTACSLPSRRSTKCFDTLIRFTSPMANPRTPRSMLQLLRSRRSWADAFQRLHAQLRVDHPGNIELRDLAELDHLVAHPLHPLVRDRQ